MQLSNNGSFALRAILGSVAFGVGSAVIALFVDWMSIFDVFPLICLWGIRPVRIAMQKFATAFITAEPSYTWSKSNSGIGFVILFMVVGWFHGELREHGLAYSAAAECIVELIDRWLQRLQTDGPASHTPAEAVFSLAKHLTIGYWGTMLLLFNLRQVAFLATRGVIYFVCIIGGSAWLALGKTEGGNIVVDLLLLLSSWYFTVLDVWSVLEARVCQDLPEYISEWLALREQGENEAKQVPRYLHRPLSQRTREIRLLVLEKGSCLSGTVKVHMMHTALAAAPPYEAISYCWGNSSPAKDIMIDGKRFAITQSAYSVLQARRSMWHDRVIWIDAICINQADEEEKTHQVWMMRDIYQMATRAIIWLGGGSKSHLAASLITELVANSIAFQGSEMDMEQFYQFERNKKYSPRWNALTELSDNAYFSRVWAIQEIAVSKQAHIYCGGLYTNWDDYVKAILHCAQPRREQLLRDQSGIVKSSKNSSFENTMMLVGLRHPEMLPGKNADTALELAEVLRYCSRFKSTDPRDMIFGLVGLAGDVDSPLVRPQYDKAVDRVYTDAARHILHSSEGSISMLAFAGIGYPRKLDRLPSWVPDWSRTQLNNPFWDTPHHYSASGSSITDITFDIDNHLAHVRGVIVDNIIEFGGSSSIGFGVEETTVDSLTMMKRVCSFYHGALEIANKNPNLWSEEPGEILHRALVADRRIAINYEVYNAWTQYIEVVASAANRNHLQQILNQHPNKLLPFWSEQRADVFNFHGHILHACEGRRLCVTARHMGLVPLLAEVGDIVAVLHGAATPYLLRRKQLINGKNEVYQLVGECCFTGIMDGEAMDFEKEELITLG